MEISDLENRFIYHAPNANKAQTHEDVRSKMLNLAFYLNSLLPEGREKSLAVTKLEEVMFWANASIARSNGQD